MPDRTVSGPPQDFLTEQEAADFLNLDTEDFREYVRMGIFPRGIPHGKRPGKHRWPWMDVVAVGHLMARGHLKLPGQEAPEDAPKTPQK